MIFDITYLDDSTNIRYKPKNKASCQGFLIYENTHIASIETLAVVWTSTLSMISGNFKIEWHRMGEEDTFRGGELALVAEYSDYREGSKTTWHMPDIQPLHDGTTLVIKSLSDILNQQIVFFSRQLIITTSEI